MSNVFAAPNYPHDLTPKQRHETRLVARKTFESCPSLYKIIVILQESDALSKEDFLVQWKSRKAIRAWQMIFFNVARASCPVHPDMFTILHEDEKIDGQPCPLCWSAAAIERK